ncbi:MAG: GIY-YIG nuclease family protein [Clostridium sp.]|nr:GIY-YIG nuclease family protein [Clostridium sp.]
MDMKEYNKNYYKENKEYFKNYRLENKENLNEYSKNYYKINKDKWIAYRNKDSFNCVYLFRDVDGEIFRIGSTSNLKNRLVQYFNSNVFKGWGIWKWFNTMKLDNILFIQTDSREKAYALEGELIKKYKPILNSNDIRTSCWDKYIESLGDLNNIEELFEEFNIDYYKNIYKNLL